MSIFELFNISKSIEIIDGNVYLMKYPVSIMSPNMFSDIQLRLIQEIGIEEASKKLYSTAKNGFYKFMNESAIKRKFENEIDVINFTNKVLTLTGWGKFSAEQDSFKKKIIVKVENSFMAREYGDSTYPCDFMLAGFLAGGLSGALKSNFDGTETKCMACKNSHCEIEIIKTS
mgnify:CR=1 FL=1